MLERSKILEKDTIYSNFEEIVKEKGITPYRVAKETGISTATLTSWKKGAYIPKLDKLIKISTYLGVPIEKLIETQKERESKCTIYK